MHQPNIFKLTFSNTQSRSKAVILQFPLFFDNDSFHVHFFHTYSCIFPNSQYYNITYRFHPTFKDITKTFYVEIIVFRLLFLPRTLTNNQFSLCFSKQAVFDGKKAIRGGIPFVFRKYTRQNKVHC